MRQRQTPWSRVTWRSRKRRKSQGFARGQVEEHMIPAVLVDADGQLLGKEPQRLAVLGLEGDVRIPVGRDVAFHHLVEVAELVALGAEPVVLLVGQDGIQQHEPTNQPTHRRRLPVPVVGLPDRRVERLVLDVIHPSAPQPGVTGVA